MIGREKLIELMGEAMSQGRWTHWRPEVRNDYRASISRGLDIAEPLIRYDERKKTEMEEIADILLKHVELAKQEERKRIFEQMKTYIENGGSTITVTYDNSHSTWPSNILRSPSDDNLV